MTRLIAVLGYSSRGASELHPVCAARLARAELEAGPGDVVLFSGWARRGRVAGAEADLMAQSWQAPIRARIADRSARTTLGNAIGVGRAARRVDADQVVLVTSSWHSKRAAVLVRASLLGSGAELRLATTAESVSPRHGLRELVAWTLVPVLALIAARTR
jgi:uncharacterized SAM-binding protein YcdF (DUF218 family)